jgi:3-hydroxymyristoyl/3-hydroxydecanoyl-(acyl carrier protein) dehydratase
MDEVWHTISYGIDASNSAVRAEACVKTGSPWYSGHFPNEPILPGIAILAMVTDVIKHHESAKGRNISMSSIRKVRFRQPVRPDEVLAVSVPLSMEVDDLSYHFKVTVSEKMVCTGIVAFELLP